MCQYMVNPYEGHKGTIVDTLMTVLYRVYVLAESLLLFGYGVSFSQGQRDRPEGYYAIQLKTVEDT